ncbi:hypothetical protein NC653_040447 [Populus alba x Populus x berolinensis]|uniref:Uncharacterized protein n=1 Tax=Populus alba x Populus x berolinensis TaxID=444605 RepID=A0AAD6PPP2_9ROSI|nr:hypothetical protein NC653_040447 [Populus alba x Populus x berolinensis]
MGKAGYIERKRCNEILDPELMTQTSGEAKLYQYFENCSFECLGDRPFRRANHDFKFMAMFKELQPSIGLPRCLLAPLMGLTDMEVVICAADNG